MSVAIMRLHDMLTQVTNVWSSATGDGVEIENGDVGIVTWSRKSVFLVKSLNELLSEQHE